MLIQIRPFLRAHWFYAVAVLVLGSSVFFALDSRGKIDRLFEAGLIFDLVVLIPCLYWMCYRDRGRKAVIRAAAIACLGIWLALKLVPESERELLEYIAPLRYIGLAALIWLEVVVMVAIYRSAFRGKSEAEITSQAAETADLPPWAARLLAKEALLWRKLWHWLIRVLGGR